MQGEIRREEWIEYFRDFSRRNQSRPTKLEIFGELGAQSEERHLPLGGVSVEETAQGTRLEIMLGAGTAADPRHLTHTITRVTRIMPKLSESGSDEAIEIESADGSKTLLCFETLAELGAA